MDDNKKRSIEDFFSSGQKRRRIDMNGSSDDLYTKLEFFLQRIMSQEEQIFNKLSTIDGNLKKFDEKIEHLEKRVTMMGEKFSKEMVMMEERVYENMKGGENNNNFFDYAIS
jgi:predicted  nucleic acid-binding Zn-ribbon protein